MNDSLRTEVFVRYTPENIACACIFLSARVLKVKLSIIVLRERDTNPCLKDPIAFKSSMVRNLWNERAGNP